MSFKTALTTLSILFAAAKGQFNQPHCTTTGPGVCNFALEWPTAGHNFAGWVYDMNCKLIASNTELSGGTTTNSANLQILATGQMLGTVTIDIPWNTTDASGFYYGGYSFYDFQDTRKCYCYEPRDESFSKACQCAIPC